MKPVFISTRLLMYFITDKKLTYQMQIASLIKEESVCYKLSEKTVISWFIETCLFIQPITSWKLSSDDWITETSFFIQPITLSMLEIHIIWLANLPLYLANQLSSHTVLECHRISGRGLCYSNTEEKQGSLSTQSVWSSQLSTHCH